jgi:hypothetical protein
MNLYHNFGGRTLVFAVLVTRCHLRCLWHLDGMALDPLNSATRCWALLLSERVSVGQPLLVASPSEARVGHFLPDCPVAPRLPGSFYDLNYQEDRRPCFPVDNARSMQLGMPRTDRLKPGRKVRQRAGWVHDEPAIWRIGNPSGRFFGNGNRLGYDCNRQS